ncbi:hypothetical protein LEP1GSC196_2064 [Leptospira meyeri serovar Semaranga str. Veldrot Semarang 173]|nr:hypothetical protein LEP1GSC196_2064 [Leptospira meyeri serovar Semaranga str. Veldrot Semarang 173]
MNENCGERKLLKTYQNYISFFSTAPFRLISNVSRKTSLDLEG